MAVTAPCPKCGKALKVPPEFLGKRVRCPACGHVFQTGPQAAPPPAPAQPSSQNPPPVPPRPKVTAPASGRGGTVATEDSAAGRAPTGFLDRIRAAWREATQKTEAGRAPEGGAGSQVTPLVGPVQGQPAHCPKCGSTSIQAVTKGFGAGKGCLGVLLTGPLGVLCGFCGHKKLSSVCLQCGHRWKLG